MNDAIRHMLDLAHSKGIGTTYEHRAARAELAALEADSARLEWYFMQRDSRENIIADDEVTRTFPASRDGAWWWVSHEAKT